jgi:uncharacterized protein (TIGR03435 family)
MKPTLRNIALWVFRAFVFAPLPLAAQTPVSPPLRFDVVSIHPHPFAGDEPSNRQMLPGGRFVATATTVRTLLRIAFLIDDNRTTGAPKWVDEQLFDITATTVDRADVKTPEQFQQVIRSLLEDRFQLKFHREQEEGPIYRLEVDKPGKLGPALKPAPPGSTPNLSTNSNGARSVMNVTGASMADIASALHRPSGRPVEDHTALTGTYNFSIQWAPVPTPDATDESLFTALKDQLNLKLQPAKGTIELLVIDSISQPSAN